MSTKVTFLELAVFAGIAPLASGYMEAYCRQSPELARAYAFEKISLPVKTPFEVVLKQLIDSDADVYGFSCYVWNMGLMRRLLPALISHKPDAYVMLGGPQVIRQAGRYLSPATPRVLICNGEGERTFAGFLAMLLRPAPDFRQLRNVSFYDGGELVTTEPEPRIDDLSEVPSPFLEGLFEKYRYTWMPIETNRGCPFKCNYCFWGAATGAKVYKYDDERVKKEIDWISDAGCLYLFIADANWGMLKRDLDLAHYIVQAQRRSGFPVAVFFSSSKNTPDRVAEISRVFNAAGLIATQSVALQTMNVETLKRVNRDNIRTATYTHLQNELNVQGIASHVEMIWPLPGETLDSFVTGLARLCELQADSFLIYPLLLMNNVELADKRDEYGLVTIEDPDPNSEAELVIRTREVSTADYEEGARYIYTVTGLYTLRGLWTMARYLSDVGSMSYEALFRTFLAFVKQKPAHPWSTFCEQSIETFDHVQFSNTGALMHRFLHEDREAFDALLSEFVTRQPFWPDPTARMLFEVDMLSRPYAYSNTPIAAKRHRFQELESVDVDGGGYLLSIPARHVDAASRFAHPDIDPDRRYLIDHRVGQLPFMPRKSLHEHYIYCQDAIHRIRRLMPRWQPVDQADRVWTAGTEPTKTSAPLAP